MPSECYLKFHPNFATNCRPHVVDHCKAGEVQVAEDTENMEDSYDYEEVDSEFALSAVGKRKDCRACASAYEDAGGCPFALKRKWLSIRMPSKCYLKLNKKSAVNCRRYVFKHCKKREVQVAEDKEITEESYLYEEVESEFAVSSEDCQACASAYKDAGGCPYALKSKWYKIRMPSECYLKFHPNFGVNCRPHVVDHCKAGEVEVAEDKAITEDSYISEEVDSEFAVSSEDCQACASAYKDAGR